MVNEPVNEPVFWIFFRSCVPGGFQEGPRAVWRGLGGLWERFSIEFLNIFTCFWQLLEAFVRSNLKLFRCVSLLFSELSCLSFCGRAVWRIPRSRTTFLIRFIRFSSWGGIFETAWQSETHILTVEIVYSDARVICLDLPRLAQFLIPGFLVAAYLPRRA